MKKFIMIALLVLVTAIVTYRVTMLTMSISITDQHTALATAYGFTDVYEVD